MTKREKIYLKNLKVINNDVSKSCRPLQMFIDEETVCVLKQGLELLHQLPRPCFHSL